MPPARRTTQPAKPVKTETEPAAVIDFGEKDDGLIRVVLFGTGYDISPTREIMWINAKIRETIAAAGKNPEDMSEFTPERASEATREWVRKITQTDASYELSLAVYNRLDEQAHGRLGFFGIGLSSPPDSE